MKLHLRAAWQALRGYAAAQENRASIWSPSGGSANGEVGMAAASVARRARDAVRNDPYAARIVDLWTGNAVGAGITTRWPETAQGAAWLSWAESTACDAEGKLDLYGLQALAMRAVVESGECFIRLLSVPTSPRNPIPRLLIPLCPIDFPPMGNRSPRAAPSPHPPPWIALPARSRSSGPPARGRVTSCHPSAASPRSWTCRPMRCAWRSSALAMRQC